ncbi:MAG TPA: hypothetical protein VMF10_04725, partial [Candidatus Aquilonibacter sp.]|nr:hypothetical protein [Candidatus Aquilonibacter sp.]
MPVTSLTVSPATEKMRSAKTGRNAGQARLEDVHSQDVHSKDAHSGNLRSEEARPQKVGFVSLGCPKNLVDSEVMMGLLAGAGAELSPRAEDADVIVVNTCAFIASAQEESVNTILEMAEHKSSGRAKKLVVAGCLVERFRDEIRSRIPEVDAVVGTGELQNILAATGVAPVSATPQSNSPFVVLNSGLNSRPEGD